MIHIVTALPCEAKPLIKHYRLNGQQTLHGFRIYENDEIRLIISGLGKINCAAACAYLQGRHSEQQTAWLNIGIAGHANLAIGTAILASKISDANNNQRYYPPGLPDSPCPRFELISLDQATNSYPGNAVYDMEAAAFYMLAIRFSNSEAVQCMKIISDNKEIGIEQINAEKTEALIAGQIEQIAHVIQQLQQCNQELQTLSRPAFGFSEFTQKWRFTVSQQHQLQRLLQQWQARSEQTITIDNFAELTHSKLVIKQLQKTLTALPYRFES